MQKAWTLLNHMVVCEGIGFENVDVVGLEGSFKTLVGPFVLANFLKSIGPPQTLGCQDYI